ncbi:MAG: hypothetical protein AB8C46_25785 [Burkholderiaceae bacterium]
MKAPIIMIKLAGRSPRLVKRWRELGLLPGFSKLTEQSPPQTIREHWTKGGEYGVSQRLPSAELWANTNVSDSLSVQMAGINSGLPDLGAERVIASLASDLRARHVAPVLSAAGVSMRAIGRALLPWPASPLQPRAGFDRASLDWWRWEVFKARWLASEPSLSQLSLPGPDQQNQLNSPSQQFDPRVQAELQVEYARTVMASYLMVDAIMQQAADVADRRRVALLVSIESAVGPARVDG